LFLDKQNHFSKDSKSRTRRRQISQTQWHTPIITALGKLKQEIHKFKASLGYIVRLCLKKEGAQ
jgi:hypothetical protein